MPAVWRTAWEESCRWAGQYRSSDMSIGADWRQVRMQVPALLADITYLKEHRVEIAIRFPHRLVSLTC
ncbi:MAG: hypothetical protein VKL58_00915 [Cyanobacteriota bacterium]|nr:hypothetical protein [Cyanobacteriota bacterium]